MAFEVPVLMETDVGYICCGFASFAEAPPFPLLPSTGVSPVPPGSLERLMVRCCLEIAQMLPSTTPRWLPRVLGSKTHGFAASVGPGDVGSDTLGEVRHTGVQQVLNFCQGVLRAALPELPCLPSNCITLATAHKPAHLYSRTPIIGRLRMRTHTRARTHTYREL